MQIYHYWPAGDGNNLSKRFRNLTDYFIDTVPHVSDFEIVVTMADTI